MRCLTSIGRRPTTAVRSVAVVAVLLGACASASDEPRPLRDRALVEALRGAWCNSDDGGRTCWAYDIFHADGTLRACGRFPDESQPFDGTGVVGVEGNVMCYRVTRATPGFWVKPGTAYCTRILSVSGTSHTYQDMDSGRTFRLFRVPLSAARCDAGAP